MCFINCSGRRNGRRKLSRIRVVRVAICVRRPAVLCRPVMWLLLAAHVGFLYLRTPRSPLRRRLGLSIPVPRPAPRLRRGAHFSLLLTRRADLYRTDIEMPTLPWKLTAVPTSLLTFFLVFYSGNCYTRYYSF